MAQNRIWGRLLRAGIDIAHRALTSGGASRGRSGRAATRSRPARVSGGVVAGGADARELDPRSLPGLALAYAPSLDGEADAGEIVWTWIPYAERDGRGKDRPVLVIGRESAERVYVVKLTTKGSEGSREHLSIGSGPWDSQGRESWVDLDQLYSVRSDGIRREASALDLDRFTRVAHALQQRYGWRAA